MIRPCMTLQWRFYSGMTGAWPRFSIPPLSCTVWSRIHYTGMKIHHPDTHQHPFRRLWLERSLERCCRAEVGYSKTIQSKFPFPKRSFVKASFFDTANTQVATKSILYQALPPVQIPLLLQQSYKAPSFNFSCYCSLLWHSMSVICLMRVSSPRRNSHRR